MRMQGSTEQQNNKANKQAVEVGGARGMGGGWISLREAVAEHLLLLLHFYCQFHRLAASPLPPPLQWKPISDFHFQCCRLAFVCLCVILEFAKRKAGKTRRLFLTPTAPQKDAMCAFPNN